MTEVFLALGGNLGDRVAALRNAVARLGAFVDISICSRVFETPAAYVEDQPPFLNMALSGRTDLSAIDLLAEIKRLEVEIGRAPSVRYGPRLIDIDIIFFGDLVVEAADLTIPHPRLSERAFVLAPLADIAPEKHHPISGQTVTEMLNALPASSQDEIRELGPLDADIATD